MSHVVAPALDSVTATLSRTIEGTGKKLKRDDSISFDDFYEIKETVTFINERKGTRVALQLPDALLGDAVALSEVLQSRLGKSCKVFVLADTSYGSCCVDEVAAQHANCDLIVHYGDACLSPTRRFPVRYVFGRARLDPEAILRSLSDPQVIVNHFASLSTAPKALVVCFELQYQYTASTLGGKLAELKSAKLPCPIVVARVHSETSPLAAVAKPAVAASSKGCACEKGKAMCSSAGCGCAGAASSDTATPGSSSSIDVKAGAALVPEGCFSVGGYEFGPLPCDIKDCAFVFVGRECSALTNIVLNFTQTPLFSCDPLSGALRYEDARVSRTLARRFFLMEKAKNASIVGIVVGTLGVANYLDVISHMKRLISAAGKKWYMVLVGKLNEPKLSNFSEIDIFVLVACPINTMFDSTGYFKDVITPLELQISLTRGAQWSGAYSTDFRQVLPGGRFDQRTIGQAGAAGSSSDEADGVRYSVVTRSLQAEHSDAAGESKALVAAPGSAGSGSSTALSLVTASDRMQLRSFKGLDPAIGADAPARVEMGLSGIARHYASEDELMKLQQQQSGGKQTASESKSDAGSIADSAADRAAGSGTAPRGRRVVVAASRAKASVAAAAESAAAKPDSEVERVEESFGEPSEEPVDFSDFL